MTDKSGPGKWARISRDLAAEQQVHPALCTCGCPLHDHQPPEGEPARPNMLCDNYRTCRCTGWQSSTEFLREGKF